MRVSLAVVLTCVLQAFTEENAPCLQIVDDSNASRHVKAIVRMKLGDSLALKCFLKCERCEDRDAVRWNVGSKSQHLVLLDVSHKNAGVYTCEHSSRNLTRSVKISVINRRARRDNDYYRNTRPISFDDYMKLYKEASKWMNDQDIPWYKHHSDESDEDDDWEDEHHDRDAIYESTLNNFNNFHKEVVSNHFKRIIIIVVVVIVLIIVTSIIVYCTCLTLRKRSQPASTTTREVRPLNREPTSCPPVVSTVQTSDHSAPPPSYEEAMCNTNFRPTAPYL